jgi:cellobiose phosphorylase
MSAPHMPSTDRNDPRSYYAFHDSEKEIVFLRHDAPTPWMNYLSNGVFHAMISQAGGGLAFYRSPQIWRFTRYRFFHLPTDRSGPYFYIRDDASGEYWSPTSEPTHARPDRWLSAHGMGYTRFHAERNSLSADATYTVGPFENALLWNLRLRNDSPSPKSVRVFAYVEFGMMEFMRELQWQCYNKHQVDVSWLSNAGALVYRYGVEMQPRPDETPLAYFAADRMPDAFDGDRDEFIGNYRSEANPLRVEEGQCGDSELRGGDPCGALQFNLSLSPGEETTFNVFLGAAKTHEDVLCSLHHCREKDFFARSLGRVQKDWDQFLGRFASVLPDEDAQRQINIWNPYQAERNFLFSRNISFYATGTFRGVGFRDTAQDVLAIIPFDADSAKDKLRLLLGQQYRDGHANHYFFPIEGWPPVTSVHSDDHLWPIWAAWSLVMETGELDFLREPVPCFDGDSVGVYEHLLQAVAFSRNHIGPNGLPLMLRSDWNDQLFKVCREGKGESFWTAMQLGVMLQKLAELARRLGKENDAADLLNFYEELRRRVRDIGWDGQWFRRAIMDDGRMLGSDAHDQAKIWLNAQTWAVISGMDDGERGRIAMDSVHRWMDTPLGIKKIHPPITTFPDPKDPLTHYHPGTGENGAIFCHANTWAVIAECLLGRGDIAYKYYRQLLPNVAMEKAGAWRYKAEPYVYSSNLFGPDSTRFGLANVSWLTGTAAWMYVAATQYILGIRPEWDGLLVDPCIPHEWKKFSVQRNFRGCRYDIRVLNPSGLCKGRIRLNVDGKAVEGNVIPHLPGRKHARVEARLET